VSLRTSHEEIAATKFSGSRAFNSSPFQTCSSLSLGSTPGGFTCLLAAKLTLSFSMMWLNETLMRHMMLSLSYDDNIPLRHVGSKTFVNKHGKVQGNIRTDSQTFTTTYKHIMSSMSGGFA
jgi:hypothetical protein